MIASTLFSFIKKKKKEKKVDTQCTAHSVSLCWEINWKKGFKKFKYLETLMLKLQKLHSSMESKQRECEWINAQTSKITFIILKKEKKKRGSPIGFLIF